MLTLLFASARALMSAIESMTVVTLSVSLATHCRGADEVAKGVSVAVGISYTEYYLNTTYQASSAGQNSV